VPKANTTYCELIEPNAPHVPRTDTSIPQCHETLTQDYVECGGSYKIHFPPGACGWYSKLNVSKDYNKVTIHTCGTYAHHFFDTSVWHGHENGTTICEEFDDSGGKCPDHRNGPGPTSSYKDGFCINSQPSQGVYVIGVEGQEYKDARIENNKGNYTVDLYIECKAAGDRGTNEGDPKMSNIKGERFDIVREGLADLLIIRDGTKVLLRIQAMIKRILPSCKGRFVCNFGLFTTEVILSGSWTKRKFRFGIEKAQNKDEPSVLIDGAEAWPLSEKNPIFSELSMQVSNFSSSDQGLRFDFMNTTLDIRRIIQNYKVCTNDNKVKFLNVYFRGATELLNKGMTIGGILGHDPHDDWEKCDISHDKSDLLESWETKMKFEYAKID